MLALLAVLLLEGIELPPPPALELDFPAIHIGVAEYQDGPTGATVFYFPKTAKVAVDVRGGAPATIDTDGLRLAYDEPYVDAISFAGGSSYGLAAATGVSHEIKARSAASGDWGNIASVAGAIIFDLGGRRYNTIVPDFELGRAALRAAKPGSFPLGPHGAGRFAMQGGYFGDALRVYSGQGGAFRQVGDVKVAVFTVVNSLGVVVDRKGEIARCHGRLGPCGRVEERIAKRVAELGRTKTTMREDDARPTESTTLTLVVTNQKLPFWALQRLAVQVHTSMARAIQPFHTTRDGDVLFAASTDEVANDTLSVADLGVVASETAWDAVLASLPEIGGLSDLRPIELPRAALERFVGTYEFAPGVVAQVSREGDGLRLVVNKSSIYLTKDVPVALVPISANEFLIPGDRGSRVSFADDGLRLNPGWWALTAKRRK